MDNVSPDTWQVKALDHGVTIVKHADNSHEFLCSADEYNAIWYDYFDLKTDYSDFAKLAVGDEYLTAAVKYGYGIRILRQDLWEMIISFVISQQNNIPRIKSLIRKLCEPYGERFPTQYELAEHSVEYFKNLGFGYRSEYLYRIAQDISSGRFDLDKLRNMQYPDAIRYLLKLHGVGIKVANCIALFGLYKTEAFPVDVWIQRIITRHYNGAFNYKKFGQYAGIIQQYMYFYERSLQNL